VRCKCVKLSVYISADQLSSLVFHLQLYGGPYIPRQRLLRTCVKTSALEPTHSLMWPLSKARMRFLSTEAESKGFGD
jgi:hypothetical protein